MIVPATHEFVSLNLGLLQLALSSLAKEYGIVSKAASKKEVEEHARTHDHDDEWLILYTTWSFAGLGWGGSWTSPGPGFLCPTEGFGERRSQAMLCGDVVDEFLFCRIGRPPECKMAQLKEVFRASKEALGSSSSKVPLMRYNF